jgi:RNA polymerase sigma factor (sigma-70 family)
MAIRPISQVIEHIRRESTADLTDNQLLERFIAHREEAAFEALVRRHGPLVWGVCHRRLRDHHDAEDCFQAVFLVLARKAASLASRELLANWLYGVAHNAARKAGAANMKRRAREKHVKDMPEPAVGASRESDLPALLDLELSRLPEKYRVPILLCELQDKTHQEAARQLGCPVGTLSGRLSRARTMLAKRLAQRGLVLTAGALAGLGTEGTAAAALTAATVRVATGQLSVVSARVAGLVEGVLKTMLIHKLRKIALLVLFAAAAVGGWSAFAGPNPTTAPTPPEGSPVATEQAGEPKTPTPQAKVVVGDNYFVFPVTTELQRRSAGKSTKALVFVDGLSIIRQDGTLDSKGLDFRKLRDALKAYDRKGGIIFYACFANPAFRDGDQPTDAIRILCWALEGFGRQEGFAQATGYVSYSIPHDWKEKVAAARKAASASKEESEAEEPASGNKLVKVYPVRTPVSRELTSADCVVDILQPSDKWENGDLSQEIREAIHTYVTRLELPRKDRVHFQIHGNGPRDEVAMRFIQITAPALAKSLGFETSSIAGP